MPNQSKSNQNQSKKNRLFVLNNPVFMGKTRRFNRYSFGVRFPSGPLYKGLENTVKWGFLRLLLFLCYLQPIKKPIKTLFEEKKFGKEYLVGIVNFKF